VSLAAELAHQREAWESKPFLRRLYAEWFELIRARLATVPGPTIELGSGIGSFKEHVPDAVTTDVEPTPWAENVVDAESQPYEDGSVANLVLVDVFHHLPRPARFLDEARRVLTRGGRAVILDPYCSPLSTVAYRRFHHERVDMGTEPFEEDLAVAAAPMASNTARATLVFFRADEEYVRRWPDLPIVERRRLGLIAYPLSGGFTRPQLVPAGLSEPVLTLERLLRPALPLAAFRCLVVLERG
jgi:SAM-dependent methyltransferase